MKDGDLVSIVAAMLLSTNFLWLAWPKRQRRGWYWWIWRWLRLVSQWIVALLLLMTILVAPRLFGGAEADRWAWLTVGAVLVPFVFAACIVLMQEAVRRLWS